MTYLFCRVPLTSEPWKNPASVLAHQGGLVNLKTVNIILGIHQDYLCFTPYVGNHTGWPLLFTITHMQSNFLIIGGQLGQ